MPFSNGDVIPSIHKIFLMGFNYRFKDGLT